MAFYNIPLKAGVLHVQDVPGTLILVDGIVGAAGVDVTPIINGSLQTTMPARKAGFKYRTGYDAVQLRADVDCVVSIFLTTNDVSLGFTDGAQVNVAGGVSIVNAADARVPVDIGGGTVNVTASNVAIGNTNASPVPVQRQALSTLVDMNPVAVGTAAVQLVADPTLKRLVVRNASATQVVAIGGATVTLAKAAVVLQPSEMWSEEDAAGATWYAIADAAGADVRLLGVK